jgi:DNA-binding protein HU-beta
VEQKRSTLAESRPPFTDAAAKGEEVFINGFGKFKVKATPAREGCNPSTGDTIQIKAAKKPSFSAAKAVKDKLNG